MDDLTDREMLIAQKAAEIAVKRMQDEFYKQVGKGVVTKFFVVVGAALVGWLTAKGFVVWPK